MHGSPDRSRLWIRVFAASIALAAAAITGLLAALLRGALGQYVVWVTVGAPVVVIAWVWVRRRTQKSEQFSRAIRGKQPARPCAAISELLPCKTVAALAGSGDLLHTSRG